MAIALDEMSMGRVFFRIGILSLIIFGGVLITHTVYAADPTFVPLAETPGGPLGDLYDIPVEGDLSSFINKLFTFAIVIGAIAAVLRIAYAGYLYMGQSDMWSRKGEAKTILGDVVLGLLLLLSIYIILNQINPDILSLKALNVIKSNPVPAQGVNPNTLEFQDKALNRSFDNSSVPATGAVPASVPDLIAEAMQKLISEHDLNDKTIPLEEYVFRSFGTGEPPQTGYYCFPEKNRLGQYSFQSCVTNESNCRRVAAVVGETCTKY